MSVPDDADICREMAIDLMKHVMNAGTYGAHTGNEQLGLLLRAMADTPQVRQIVKKLNQI